MPQIEINGNIATVRIGSQSKDYEIEYRDGHPHFIDEPQVGIRIGNRGRKVWHSCLDIKKNKRWNPLIPPLAPKWTLDCYAPLNSINRGLYYMQIVDFWENIPDSEKSKR
jgi:hypothetical protein